MHEARALPRLSYEDAWILAALEGPGPLISLVEPIDRMDFIERVVPGFEAFAFGSSMTYSPV